MPGSGGGRKRCSSSSCDDPEKRCQFYRIEKGKTTGGHDWSSLVGSLLCKTCYDRFRKMGTLERTYNRPLVASVKFCTYEHCDSPSKGKKFYLIRDDEEGKTTNGHDWSPVAGKVLCRSCYEQFRKKGTLERTKNKTLHPSARRCTYDMCDRPAEGINFYQIEKGKTTGGQDWSPIVGSVLCHACYQRYSKRGTLHRIDARKATKKRRTPPEDGAQQQQQPPPPSRKGGPASADSLADGEGKSKKAKHEQDQDSDRDQDQDAASGSNLGVQDHVQRAVQLLWSLRGLSG